MTSRNGPKIALKQAEVSVQRFNDLAIPHHLGLLNNHKSNIEKSLALGDWAKIKKEEVNAMRVIKQVKNLLLEMNALREMVRDEDVARFDAMMEDGKQKAYASMKEYLELQLNAPLSTTHQLDDVDENEAYAPQMDDGLASAADIGSITAHSCSMPVIETDFIAQQHLLAQRAACLAEMENLHHEIRELNDMFHNMDALVHEQAESVQAIADHAEEALEHVQHGESNLRRALAYKKAMYPLMGALVGTCLGGPIGLVAGIKAGGLAAVGCGLIGFTGGSVLRKNPQIMHGSIEEASGHCVNATPDNMEMVKKAD